MLKRIMLAGVLSNLLAGCSTPPKLSEPKGEWVNFQPVILPVLPKNLPTAKNDGGKRPLLISTVNAVKQGRTAIKQTAKPAVPPMSGTSPIKSLNGPGVPVVVPPLAGASMGKNPFSGGAVARQVPTPVKLLPPPRLWTITPGTTLKQAFMRWAAGETCQSSRHWTVRWPVQTDYPVDSPLTFTGSFEAVTQQLFSLYRHAHTPLYVDGYRAQCLMVVSDKK